MHYTVSGQEGLYSIYIYIIITCLLLCFLTSLAFLIREKKESKRVQNEYIQDMFDRELAFSEEMAREIENRINGQRRVLKGKISEELFPLLKDCPYSPADMKFLGMPIDYIVFNGYSEAKDDGGTFHEIIFADVKTGNAKLSSHQKKIKQAVQEGRVRWETIRMNDDGSVVFERD